MAAKVFPPNVTPGVDVVVSKWLPVRPGPGEVARRIVRHGLADVLAWLGEKVGPRPDEVTHALLAADPAKPARTVLFASQEYADKLQREVTLYDDLASPDREVRQAAEAAWLAAHRAHQRRRTDG